MLTQVTLKFGPQQPSPSTINTAKNLPHLFQAIVSTNEGAVHSKALTFTVAIFTPHAGPKPTPRTQNATRNSHSTQSQSPVVILGVSISSTIPLSIHLVAGFSTSRGHRQGSRTATAQKSRGGSSPAGDSASAHWLRVNREVSGELHGRIRVLQSAHLAGVDLNNAREGLNIYVMSRVKGG